MNRIELGCVYWITGLSGSGKTTIGRLLYERLRLERGSVVFLDGDILRDVFLRSESHSLDERRQIAMQYCRLCKLISDQGIDVVCSTISLFHECHLWNRLNIARYKEIYLKVSLEMLKQRDPKKIYQRALLGELKNVVGFDLPFEEPKEPHLAIENDGSKPPIEISEIIYKNLVEIHDQNSFLNKS